MDYSAIASYHISVNEHGACDVMVTKQGSQAGKAKATTQNENIKSIGYAHVEEMMRNIEIEKKWM